MPSYKSGATAPRSASDEPTLPKSVKAYLDNGAPQGQRNDSLFRAATQLRDIGATEAVACEILTPRALSDGLPAGEINATITHVFRAAPRPAPQGEGAPRERGRAEKRSFTPLRPGHMTEKPASFAECEPQALPDPLGDGFTQLLAVAFKEGEGITIADTNEQQDGRRTPTRGVTFTREEWLQRIERKGGIDKCFSTKHGLYIRVNPMRVDGTGHDEDATAFRHVLVEFDRDGEGKDIPKDLQFGAILNTGLPITAVLDSGNKSVHAWIRVDAPDAATYEARVEQVFALFDAAALDSANRNPSRYSRCPDGWRTVEGEPRQQKLLAVNLGAESWEAFEVIRETAEVETMTTEDLDTYDTTNDPNAVLGLNRWLCRGGSVIWVSQSGVGKSSLLMNLAIGWGLNKPEMTFGIAAKRPLKALVIQAENDIGDMAEAYQGARDANNLTPEERTKLKGMITFCRITTLSGAAFCKKMEGLIQKYKPDMVWIDPLLNFIGADVSDVEVVTEFCTGWLNPISQATGVIFSIMHHTGKPPKESRAGTGSDAAYAGLGSSALTNWAREIMNLRRMIAPEGDPPTFELEACKRRKRAGMKDFITNEVTPVIHIRHASDGRMAWEQCMKPEPPKKPKKGAKADNNAMVENSGPPASGGRQYTVDRTGKAGTRPLAAGNPAEASESNADAPSEPRKAGAKSKLTPALEGEIVALLEAGTLDTKKVKALAASYGVGESTIWAYKKEMAKALAVEPATPTAAE